jgi:hypothetical protein
MTKQALEFGAQMALMDAMEKGYTEKKELFAFMLSDTFKSVVIHYAEMFEQEFSLGQ